MIYFLLKVIDYCHLLVEKTAGQFAHFLDRMFGYGSGLVVVSLVAGVILVYFYGKTSPQKWIAKLKNDIRAAIYESVVFRRDPLLSLGAQAKLFGYSIIYLLLTIPSLCILALPTIFLLASLNILYGVAPMRVGDSTTLLMYTESNQNINDYSIDSDPNSIVITGPVRNPSKEEVYWSIKGIKEGEYTIYASNKLSGEKVSLPIKVVPFKSNYITEKGNLIDFSTSILKRIIYPLNGISFSTESQVSFKEITVGSISKPQIYFDIRADWIVIFVVLSMLSGIIGSKILGVKI